MKTLFAILLTASAAFAQATVKVEHVAPNCATGNFLDALASGCAAPRIKVTVHPSNPASLAAFILVAYQSIAFSVQVVQPHFTMALDPSGDLVAVFPSGDMSNIVVSAIEVAPGQLIEGVAVN